MYAATKAKTKLFLFLPEGQLIQKEPMDFCSGYCSPALCTSLLICARLPFHLAHLNFESSPNTDYKHRLLYCFRPPSRLQTVQTVPSAGSLINNQEGHWTTPERRMQTVEKYREKWHFKVSLTFLDRVWFPLDGLNSHVAASCCVMEWKDRKNKAHDPKPPLLFHRYPAHIFFLDQMTASPSCLWPFWTPFWASHEYMHVFTVCVYGCVCA